jgi:hypothetical protein
MRIPLKSVVAGALVSLATVAVSGGANAAPCPSGVSIATYEGLGAAGCQIDDKTFFDFNYQPNNLAPPATGAGAEQVFTNGLGFNFIGFFGPGADAGLFYTAKTNTGVATIIDASLQIPGGSPPANVAEQLCLGGLIPSCPAGALRTHTSVAGDPVFTFNFSPVSEVDFAKNVSGGGAGMGGNLSIVTNLVSQTPEPASLTILAVSLLGMGIAFRRHRRR